MLQKVEGIVLRSIDYGETNKILTIYSREIGKFGAVAREAKKPNSRLASVSQPFTYGYFLCFTGQGLGTIQQGEIIEIFRSITNDLISTAYASYIVELLDKSTDERKNNPFLFELLYQTLKYIDEGYEPQIIKNIFEIKMLPVLGLRPNFDCCAICGNQDGPFVFSIKEAGILCEHCLHHDPHHLKVNQATIRLLRLFFHFDLNRLGTINVKESTKKELETCISAYYEEYSGVYLKTKKFLQQLDKLQ
ncbi:DNA repair protein RecO [Caldifermentibacillus hisashii]|uniref:DNA repair protein RecO n=1 Tax=Caldifermentibacillus hisashii TaxID=996558 RepID=UPI0031B7B34A